MLPRRRDLLLFIAPVLPLAAALPLAAEDESRDAQEAREFVASIAAALAEANSQSLDELFQKGKADLDDFRTHARILMDTYLIASTIKPVSNEGNGSRRELVLDWRMELKTRSDELKLEVREGKVKCTLERAKRKRWVVSEWKAEDLFRLPATNTR